MTTKFAIVTDSTSDMPAELAQQRQIYVAPLHVMWGTETLRDGVDITPEEFYKRLGAESELPTTSQPTPAALAELYEKARQETGAETIIALTISADLSGTYSSAQQAIKMVDFPVHAIDLRTTTLAQSLSVFKVADLRDQGGSVEEAVALAESLRARTKVIFTLDTLEYLHKGGRIGGARRLLGTALNIKPILHVVDGKIEARESVRTRKRAQSRLVELLAEEIDPDKPVSIGVLHGNAQQEAETLAAAVLERWTPEQLVVAQVGTAIGVHTGPGAVGFAIVQ